VSTGSSIWRGLRTVSEEGCALIDDRIPTAHGKAEQNESTTNERMNASPTYLIS
jgi:hypothetical protein